MLALVTQIRCNIVSFSVFLALLHAFVVQWTVLLVASPLLIVIPSSYYQEAIFRVLAAILHLGNIEFSPGKEHDSSAVKNDKSRFHLQMAADLFM